MRIRCPGCGQTEVEGRCPKCGKPPMSSQLKWALLSFVAVVVLAVLSLRGGPDIDPAKKNPPAPPVAASPSP